jgi:putative restriction endonuclease
MPRRNWTREETLVAFNLYCRTPFGRLWEGNPEIVAVAQAIGRTPGAVAMKCCNLAAFDAAHQERGVTGLRNASRLDAELWAEFVQSPEAIAFEAEQAYATVMQEEMRAADDVEWEDVQGLDRVAVTRVRVTQHFFRSLILTGYRSQCAVCEMPIASLLVASHIVPWSVDRSLRMNPQNGICLCSLHDRAFDTGLLVVSRDFRISIHATVGAHGGVRPVAENLLRFEGNLLHLPERWHPDAELLVRRGNLGLCNVG